MALKGNLRDFSFTQLLNLINLAHKSGALVIEGPNEVARILFRDGKLAFAQVGAESPRLLPMLLKARQINVAQARALADKMETMSDKALGIYLINAGILTQDDIYNSIQTCLGEAVRQLFSWVEGFFRFETGEMPPEDRIPVRMNLENLIVEGSRQMQELEQLQEEIPSLEMALKFTDRPGTNIRNVNLSVEEWRVVSYVNPKNSMKQIARATKLNELEIRRVVYALLQAGLVEIIRPGGAPVALGNRVFQTPDHEEQRSLVNKLIHRIRTI